MQGVGLRHLLADEVVLVLRVGPSLVLEPPDADVVGGTHQHVHVAIEVEVFGIDICGGKVARVAVGGQVPRVPHPRSLAQLLFGGAFPPAVRNENVEPTVTVGIPHSQPVVIAEGPRGVFVVGSPRGNRVALVGVNRLEVPLLVDRFALRHLEVAHQPLGLGRHHQLGPAVTCHIDKQRGLVGRAVPDLVLLPVSFDPLGVLEPVAGGAGEIDADHIAPAIPIQVVGEVGEAVAVASRTVAVVFLLADRVVGELGSLVPAQAMHQVDLAIVVDVGGGDPLRAEAFVDLDPLPRQVAGGQSRAPRTANQSPNTPRQAPLHDEVSEELRGERPLDFRGQVQWPPTPLIRINRPHSRQPPGQQPLGTKVLPAISLPRTGRCTAPVGLGHAERQGSRDARSHSAGASASALRYTARACS